MRMNATSFYQFPGSLSPKAKLAIKERVCPVVGFIISYQCTRCIGVKLYPRRFFGELPISMLV